MPIAGILAVLLHAAAVTTASPGIARPVVHVAIQPETGTAIDRRMLTDIASAAREIWRPYADVSFDLVDETVRPAATIRLIITNHTNLASDPASLGWIEFVDGRPSNVLTISTAAAVALLKGSQWGTLPPIVQRAFMVRAMARAIAHELGHYLLASRSHARHGLMRGQLTAEDIMHPWPSSTRLERSEVERLGRGVLLAMRDDKRDDIKKSEN